MVGSGYWLFPLFFLIPAVYAGSRANQFFGSSVLTFRDLEPGLDIILTLILFFFAGLGQELCWTGFLLPHLRPATQR